MKKPVNTKVLLRLAQVITVAATAAVGIGVWVGRAFDNLWRKKSL